MAESPCGQGRTPSAEAHGGLLRAAPKQAAHRGRERSDRASWGAVSAREAAAGRGPDEEALGGEGQRPSSSWGA
eukprot:3843532-Alexandrium_andersonii.AAC.1